MNYADRGETDMLCENCKTREATIKYVEVINGVKSEHNLCAHCASRLDIGQYSSLFEGEFPIGRLLSGILGRQDTDSGEERYAQVVCPTCGMTYREFVKDSRFGCADCYSVFDPLIGETIKHLQGTDRHVGKHPSGGTPQTAETSEGGADGGAGENAVSAAERIRLLQSRIRTAVDREEYEEAAALRDELRRIREETGQNG